MYLPYVKDVFNCISDAFLSLDPKTLRFFIFAAVGLKEIKDHSL